MYVDTGLGMLIQPGEQVRLLAFSRFVRCLSLLRSLSLKGNSLYWHVVAIFLIGDMLPHIYKLLTINSFNFSFVFFGPFFR